MVVPFANAAAAYAATARAPATPGPAAAPQGPSFGEMLRDVAQESIETMKQGEQKSIEGALGRADLTDVVTAVANAETTLQAVVAVRDRVITAYQEILRMPM